jgi:cytochrome c biogenesis protein CcdA/thiol-disulfide isomerase/thioredoxin
VLLFILAYFGGVLTILSPCILPVLPFVFARSDQPFVRSGLPMLAGMALTFAGVATLAAIGGGWAVEANQAGRIAALVLLAFFGVTLLFPSLAEHASRPLVGLGNRLSNSAQNSGSGTGRILSSFLLGIGTGLLWAPCAGPILGLVLTGAALEGATAKTSLLLLAYGAGAATSLAAALLIGGRLFKAMKRSLGAGEWIRRGLGVAVLAGVAAIALGADTGLLTRISLASTGKLEQTLTDRLMPQPAEPSRPVGAGADDLENEGELPPLTGATLWLNSPPLTAESLQGKVVLVDFWTYSCINCLRALPYIQAWADKYKDKGLVVIGVHAPEFAFEKDPDNVRKAVADLHITYPVALDNDYAIWRMFNNKYWPAHYFIDAKGIIRHHHFGEGNYAESEKVIQQLLAEAGHKDVGTGLVKAAASGIEMAADKSNDMTPETYVNYSRGERFSSPEETHDAPQPFTAPATLEPHHWALAGTWTIGEEHSTLNAANGKIVYRFHARDLHLVLGPDADGKPVRFRVTLDGKAPGPDHGVDTDADGQGTVTGQRLYQLIRQNGGAQDRTFEIEFLDPGVQAFAFTFG